MKDNELRGMLLERFYELRHRGDPVQIRDLDMVAPNERMRIVNVCEQLNQHGLIEWDSVRGLGSDEVGGIGKITASGVDVVEGTARAPISVTLHSHDHSISVHGSSYVQIGSANVQGSGIDIGKLMAAVDGSNATEAEKKEAKSLLKTLAENKLVAAALAWYLGLGTGAH